MAGGFRAALDRPVCARMRFKSSFISTPCLAYGCGKVARANGMVILIVGCSPRCRRAWQVSFPAFSGIHPEGSFFRYYFDLAGKMRDEEVSLACPGSFCAN